MAYAAAGICSCWHIQLVPFRAKKWPFIMGAPKKWYLAENGNAIVLYYGDSPEIKLADSDKLLGRVFDIILPKKGKYACEGVNVSSSITLCMNVVYNWFVFSLSAKM